MKLEPEGRNRLDKMKKTLAAGLPLAGLLAASAAVGAAAQGCIERHTMGKFPAEPQPEEWVLDGDIAPPEDEADTAGEGMPGAPEVPDLSNISNLSTEPLTP
ncbi:MAG: hypothetical protein IK066_01115 [Kiritimatiellae bacterium]|nr:hypothetical protein [Kiritimatiellia bacterium]